MTLCTISVEDAFFASLRVYDTQLYELRYDTNA